MKIRLAVIAFIVVSALLTSCKKDWVCTCTFGTSGTDATQLSSLSRKEARSICDDRKSELVLSSITDVECKISKK